VKIAAGENEEDSMLIKKVIMNLLKFKID